MNDTLVKLEGAIRAIPSLEPQAMKNLLGLVAAAKAESDRLAQTHQAAARLAQSVAAFEGAHPKLVEIAEEIFRRLSSIGI